MIRFTAVAFWLAVFCGTLCAQSPWIGEWGTFRATVNHTFKGAGITVSDCKGQTCAIAIHVNQIGNGSASGTLNIISANEAVAHLAAFGQEHCSLRLSLVDDSKFIHASSLNGDCGYFQTPGATFVGTFALHSRIVFASDRTEECFAAEDEATLVLCRDKDLSDTLKRWKLLFDQVQNLNGPQNGVTAMAAENVAKNAFSRVCETTSPVGACIRRAMEEAIRQLEARRAAWKKSVTTPGERGQAVSEANAIQGAYRRRLPNGDVQGDHFTSTDTLRISPLSDGHIHYDLELNFFNGHECSLDGDALWTAAGVFVDRKQSSLGNGQQASLDSECFFELKPTATGVALADPTGACREMSCGARGGYNGAGFSFRDRVAPNRQRARVTKESVRK